MPKKRIMLIIMDGWGIREQKSCNAVKLAKTPTYKRLLKHFPNTELRAAEEYVGLEKGVIGNSEVGHINIGAGRIVKQELTRINKSIKNGSFFRNAELLKAMKNGRSSALHLVGLLSNAGVHSHINHLLALLEMAKKQNVKNIYLHIFPDGRDMQPKSIKTLLPLLDKKLKETGAKLATIAGRYYGMDRDERLDRTKKAFECITEGKGRFIDNLDKAIDEMYRINLTDEFFDALILEKIKLKPKEQFILFNFRSDRMRQLTWQLKKRFKNILCMCEYDKELSLPVLFLPEKITNNLGEIIAKNRLKQLRVAETEKYPHVTYFFNSGIEKPFKNEYRVIVPSPKIATYDLQPEMSALKVTIEVLKRMDKFDFIVLNYANPDMVGHTGNIPASIKAVETVDLCVNRIIQKCKKTGTTLVITADHGNCEEMRKPYETSHTLNKVPFIIYTREKIKLKKNGVLADIAPTILKLFKIKKPKEMKGNALF